MTMKPLDKTTSHRALGWIVSIAFYAYATAAQAAIVTVWEDQFTSISAGWNVPASSTFITQASPFGVIGSEDGFEAKFTNTAGVARYAVLTIPAGLVQAGDMVQYAIRSDFSNKFAADRVNLVSPSGGNAFDSGFVVHDSAGGLTFRSEPGTVFSLANTTLTQGLRATNNLFLGNNGYGGGGIESIFYIDYIRIVGERIVPGDHSWNQNSSGSWNSAANWTNGVPNANNHGAILGGVNSQPSTITVDSPVTVKTIQFDSDQGFAVSGLAGLTLAADSGSASIDVLQAATAGRHQFQTAVTLGSNTTINVAAGAKLDFNSSLNLNGRTLSINSGITNINNVVAAGGGTVNNSAILGGGGTIAGDLANNATGTLRADILGTGPFDVTGLAVSGTASLAGTLDISLGGFNPSNGQQFTVLTAGNLMNNGLSLHASDIGRFVLSFSGNNLVVRAFGSGDYNGNGVVDAADFVIWRNSLGSTSNLAADGSGNGIVDSADYDFWRQRFGTSSGVGAQNSLAIPEPTAVCLAIAWGLLLTCRRTRVDMLSKSRFEHSGIVSCCAV
jgi:hypothetical protein